MGINIVANFVSPAYDISNLYPEKIDFRLGGLITSILSVLVCPWIFVSSPQAITIFVSIFGAALGPMFGIMVADYYLVKRQQMVLDDLYTMSPKRLAVFRRRLEPDGADRARRRRLRFDRAGAAWRLRCIPNIGDWGWLIGAALGAALYMTLMRHREAPALLRAGDVVA